MCAVYVLSQNIILIFEIWLGSTRLDFQAFNDTWYMCVFGLIGV